MVIVPTTQSEVNGSFDQGGITKMKIWKGSFIDPQTKSIHSGYIAIKRSGL